MANRNGKHLLHVRSNQLIEGKPKLPTIDDIDYGEIAINYADGNEKLSIRSSSDAIRTISTDEQNDLKFATKERVAEIDEVVSKAFDTMNKSCGFNEEMTYIPQNELIQGTSSLSEAIEKVAEKANKSAESTDLELYLTKDEASLTYATKEEIPDVSQFITKDVSGLTYYYDKTDIDKKISEIKTLKAVVIESLPESGETDTLYLVPNKKEEENNVKDEYMWINDKWELIGSTAIDLTPYLTRDDASSTYATKEELNVIDEVVSKTFDTMNKSCGFNENVQYVPQNDLIQGCASLTEAIEIVADKANKSVDNTELDLYLTKEEASSTYSTKEELTEELNTKQDTLVSEANIKTINGESILGSGNIEVGNTINVVSTTGTSETYVMSQKAVSDELTRIDTVTSESFDNYFAACGFKNGEVKFSSDVEVIKSAQSIIGALEILGSSMALKSEISNVIRLTSYLYGVNTVDTVKSLPTDKYLVIAEINSSGNTDSLSLGGELIPTQDLNVIVHNNGNSPLTITIPSSSTYINMSESTMIIPINGYGEINIVYDGTKYYVRFD